MDRHRWMVGHLISLIAYCEREGLDDVSAPLAEAMEQIAPRLHPARPGAPMLQLAANGTQLAAE